MIEPTPELPALALIFTAIALTRVPHALARVARPRPMASLANPASSHPADPAWAEQAARPFERGREPDRVRILVVMAAMLSMSTPATVFAAAILDIGR